jgi:hypothetical protein
MDEERSNPLWLHGSAVESKAAHAGLPVRLAQRLCSLLLKPSVEPWAWLASKRLAPLLFFSFLLAIVATTRHFGFDLYNENNSLYWIYPYVADGWGVWYFLANLGLNFYAFFFLANCLLAAAIMWLAFPAAREKSARFDVTQLALLFYMMFWFLFGQARYGTAVGLLAIAAFCESLPLALCLMLFAFLIHKAALGGVLLIFGWRLLRRRKHGVLLALVFCLAVSALVLAFSRQLLSLSGYAGYSYWEESLMAATPLKYLGVLALLLLWLWWWRDPAGHARNLLILALLVFPFSLYVVFAGRSYQLFFVVFLAGLREKMVPQPVKYLAGLMCAVELYILLFRTGLYF